MTIKAAAPAHTYRDLNRLMSLMTGDEKHGPAATSTLDALWVLYDQVLRVTPDTVEAPDRDRFLLSKGHGPMAYYAVLAAHGFLDEESLPGFGGTSHRWGIIRTACSSPAPRSAAVRWDTDCRWLSAVCSGSGPRG